MTKINSAPCLLIISSTSTHRSIVKKKATWYKLATLRRIANVSPDSRLSASRQEEATQECPSPSSAGPSCARLSDDQNEPFFLLRSLRQHKDASKVDNSKIRKNPFPKKSRSRQKVRRHGGECRILLQANGHTTSSRKGVCVHLG